MKITSQLAVNFHWGALRPLKGASTCHVPRQEAPVKPDPTFWQRVRWFECVTADQMNGRLHAAAAAGDGERVRHLLRHPLVKPQQEMNGRTAAHWAASAPNTEALAALLFDARVAIEATDHHGGTPLHAATGAGRLEAVQLLLSRTALSASQRDHHGTTPLMKAVLNDKPGIVSPLAMSPTADRAALEEAWLLAARKGSAEVKSAFEGALHARGVEVPVVLPPLMHALSAGDQAGALELLMQPGGEKHLDECTADGRTPLMLAARHDVGLLERILQKTDIDALRRDHQGWSPLMHAVDAGQREAVAWLLADGRFDLEGARDLALDLDKTELAQVILSAEEDVDALIHATPQQRDVYAGMWDTCSQGDRLRIQAAAARWKRETGQA